MAEEEVTAENYRFGEQPEVKRNKQELTQFIGQENPEKKHFNELRRKIGSFYREYEEKIRMCFRESNQCKNYKICDKIKSIADMFGTLDATRKTYEQYPFSKNEELYQKHLRTLFDRITDLLISSGYDKKVKRIAVDAQQLYELLTGEHLVVPGKKRNEKVEEGVLERILKYSGCKRIKRKPKPKLKPPTKLERITPKQEPEPKKPYEKPAIISEEHLEPIIKKTEQEQTSEPEPEMPTEAPESILEIEQQLDNLPEREQDKQEETGPDIEEFNDADFDYF
jgi:hypothetical protein